MANRQATQEKLAKLVEAAHLLFIEKGYDHTSIQDIQEAAGFSRGAFYHHFQSKEELMRAVLQMNHQHYIRRVNELIQEATGATGLEKLKNVIQIIATSPELTAYNRMFRNRLSNSALIVESLRVTIIEDAQIFLPFIREGQEDGTIQTEYPDEIAQLLLLMLNVWSNPMLFPATEAELLRKLSFIQGSLMLLGVDVVDESLKEIMITQIKEAFIHGEDDRTRTEPIA